MWQFDLIRVEKDIDGKANEPLDKFLGVRWEEVCVIDRPSNIQQSNRDEAEVHKKLKKHTCIPHGGLEEVQEGEGRGGGSLKPSKTIH